jgi:DNA-binding protein H-NS
MNDEPVKTKTHRLDFGKKNPNPIDQAAEDAIDESIAPLPPSTLTTGMYADDDKGEYLEPATALAITPDEADKFDDTAPDPVPEPEPEPEPVIETLTEEAEADAVEEPAEEPDVVNGEDTMNEALIEPEVDQAEGMDLTEVPVEVAESGTLDEITAADDAAREAETAAEDAKEVESIADLEAEKAKLEDQIESRKEAEKQHVCGEIAKVMAQYTVDIDYLAAFLGVKYKRRGSKAKPKYKDPMTGKTWSGRGKTPVWIRGKDFKKFLI